MRIEPGTGPLPSMAVHTLRDKPSLPMAGLLLIEIVIGYEWFVSGLVKFVRGEFPAGLAEELLKKSAEMAPWYASFIKGVVIPNGIAFGYAIEIAEVLAGVALIGGPLLWLLAWDRLPEKARLLVLVSTIVAAIGGAFLAVNLHMANAGSHPWLLPADANDEGIDLDSVLPAMQLLIATVSIILFRRLRRSSPDMPSQRNP